ncbi:hypothetical protein CORC01_01272 [Colletotrichum orchidophilum]|uniref:Uncharacterized protein n=1 Tax=Colletotrichum orchidophilum TaxID=1209926 RepID=A0A1G4BQE3_9PEZI|nr:uncharacterized protein CORC01_01272 [Colletotrichum orchidophilum]OHF03553.1 hypothetical protein CORC01_01272 [Colletotrichum orchidophilum]
MERIINVTLSASYFITSLKVNTSPTARRTPLKKISSPAQPIPVVPNTASFINEARAGFDADLKSTSSSSNAKDRQELLTSIQSFAFQFLKAAADSHSHSYSPGGKGEEDRPSIEETDSTDVLSRQGLDVLWYMFTETAQVVDADDAFQDSVVGLFGQSLRLTWRQLIAMNLPSAAAASQQQQQQRQRNLAAFSARVLAVGLCRDLIAGTAFWILCKTLEDDDDEDDEDDDDDGITDDPPPLLLLPDVVVWLEHASHELLARCCSSSSAHRRDPTATYSISPVDDPSTDQATTAEAAQRFFSDSSSNF